MLKFVWSDKGLGKALAASMAHIVAVFLSIGTLCPSVAAEPTCITLEERAVAEKRLEQLAPFNYETLAQEIITATDALSEGEKAVHECRKRSNFLGDALGACNQVIGEANFQQRRYDMAASKIESAKTFQPSIQILKRALTFPSCR
jgi:histidinol-phosphate/aromatic aminotransferase/cobyric acid decarboxylase-like protein